MSLLRAYEPLPSRGRAFASCPPVSGLRETAILQQRSDIRLPIEFIEKNVRLPRASARQYLRAKHIAIGARQAAVTMEPLTGVACENLAPEVRVVTRRIVV